MFGLPFFTSLIVTVAMVIGFSFVINHGIRKRKENITKQEGSSVKVQDSTASHA